MKASEKEPKKDRLALAHTAKEEMVTQYLPLVRLVAEGVHRRLPPWSRSGITDSFRRCRPSPSIGSL